MSQTTRIFIVTLVLVFTTGFLAALASLHIQSRYEPLPQINNCFITQVKWECGGCKNTLTSTDGYYAGGWPFRAQKKLIICGTTREQNMQTGRLMLDGLLYTLIFFALANIILRFRPHAHHRH